MFGFSCSRSAVRVGAGIELRSTSSTESPELAAQAAAGIAYSACSPETTTTFAEGSPLAEEAKRSIAAARSYGSSPSIRAVLKPLGRAGFVPIRITCASLARSEPFGSRRSSASSVIGGSSPPSVSRIGAPIGLAVRTAAVTAPCQSSLSTSTTAVGREVSLVAGNTMLATPAALATASAPPTRTVFLVAVEGKPSLARASSSSDLVPSWGGVLVVVADAAAAQRGGEVGQGGHQRGERAFVIRPQGILSVIG